MSSGATGDAAAAVVFFCGYGSSCSAGDEDGVPFSFGERAMVDYRKICCFLGEGFAFGVVSGCGERQDRYVSGENGSRIASMGTPRGSRPLKS